MLNVNADLTRKRPEKSRLCGSKIDGVAILSCNNKRESFSFIELIKSKNAAGRKAIRINCIGACTGF